MAEAKKKRRKGGKGKGGKNKLVTGNEWTEDFASGAVFALARAIIKRVVTTPKRKVVTATVAGLATIAGAKMGYRGAAHGQLACGTAELLGGGNAGSSVADQIAARVTPASMTVRDAPSIPSSSGGSDSSSTISDTGSDTGSDAGGDAEATARAAALAARLVDARIQLRTVRGAHPIDYASTNYSSRYIKGYDAMVALLSTDPKQTHFTVPADVVEGTPSGYAGYLLGGIDQMMGRSKDSARYTGSGDPEPAKQLPSTEGSGARVLDFGNGRKVSVRRVG